MFRKILIIAQFIYIKIQSKTKDLSTRLRGINTEFVGLLSGARTDVCCFRLDFDEIGLF